MRRAVRISCALVAAATLSAPALAGLPGPLDEEGGRLFMQHGCYGCHEVDGIGTPIGPRLSDLAQRCSRSDIERWLRDPSARKAHARMPRIELTAREIHSLAAWLVSFE